ncbi:MAG: (4Fe-4S)-binding protein [Bacteroidota bacterium]
MSDETIKHYTNGEITIVWQPGKCVHSTICWKGREGLLPVFDPRRRPWIDPAAAETERIIQQVERCPSGALSYFVNGQ